MICQLFSQIIHPIVYKLRGWKFESCSSQLNFQICCLFLATTCWVSDNSKERTCALIHICDMTKNHLNQISLKGWSRLKFFFDIHNRKHLAKVLFTFKGSQSSHSFIVVCYEFEQKDEQICLIITGLKWNSENLLLPLRLLSISVQVIISGNNVD